MLGKQIFQCKGVLSLVLYEELLRGKRKQTNKTKLKHGSNCPVLATRTPSVT